MKFIAIVLTLLSTVSFAQDLSQGEMMEEIKNMDQLATVYAVTGSTCSEDADCLTLAKGKKACGGPRAFVVTSVTNPRLKALKRLLKKLASWEDDYNRRFGVMSDCSVKRPPQVECIDQVCQAK